MSTTDATLAEDKGGRRIGDERATALGPGILRFSGGAYYRPSSTQAVARCLGPLCYWRIANSFFLPPSILGEEPPLFLFPLPPQASLISLKLNGEQLYPGPLSVKTLSELAESAEIPTPFESFQEEFGDEQQPVLSLNLSNWSTVLEGKPTMHLELEYANGLPTVDGRVCLSAPAFIAPHLGEDKNRSFNLQVIIEDGNELVDEPAAEPAMNSRTEGETVVLEGSFKGLTEDPLVSFRPGRTQMPVTRLRRSDEHFIFSIFPPTSIPASPQRRDIVFAVDASENLDSKTFEGVKSDLCEILRNLDENDRFALVTFGREIDGYDGGEFCEIDKVEEACSWLEGCRPQGRADVQPLLQRIQSLPSQEDRQLCIFLLAAGHVGNEPSILKSLDFDQSDRRYYTVGLGPSVKQSFLRRLALLTRGRCEVSVGGGCREPLERLLGQTRALLAEVTFEELGSESGVNTKTLVPSKMTSLTPQGPVHCLGQGAPNALRFRSKDETGVFFAGTVNAQSTDNPALPGVWAGLRVREMLDSVNLTTGAKRKTLKADASALAAGHGILTEDTVLVLDTQNGIEIQYSALPPKWVVAESKVKKGNVSNKDGAAPFDWRKGLVAREGLFKGSKVASSSDSGEQSGRYGLRAKTSSGSDKPGKPRLDRSVMSGVTAEVDEVDSVEEVQEIQPVGDNGQADVAPSPAAQQVSVPVEVSATAPPVVTLQSDGLAESRIRYDAYQQQLQNYDIRFALASLQGLPKELSPGGGELPRILAQTVAHLEKRGFFSQAVAVLGLLLEDSPSPEVEKKMESLLAAWANSLPDERLPEALQILQLGQRVCRGSEVLEQQRRQVWDKWKELSQQQGELPEVQRHQNEEAPQEAATLLSEPQLELARLKQEQSKLADQFGQLESVVKEQLEALPGLLDQAAEKTAASVVKALPEPTVVQVPVSAQPVPTPEPVSAQPTGNDQAPAVDIPLPPVEATTDEEVQSEPEPPLDIPLPQDTATPEEDEDGPVEIVLPDPAGPPKEVSPAAPAEPVSEEPEPEIAPEPEPEPEPEPVVEAEAEPAAAQPEAETEKQTSPPSSEELKIESPMVEPEPEPEQSGGLELSLDELTELLLAEPRSESSHRAVEASLKEPKERINFFRDLVKADKGEPFHSLSLARAYRAADQTKVAVVHYQKFLRSEKEPQAYLELAEAYEELGKANLASSARKAAGAFGG